MKGLVALLIVMLIVIAGTAWLAQEWRLEATQYETEKKKQGEILKQQLESEGIKARAEILADFDRQGAEEAANIDAETERIGRTNVARAEVDRSKSEFIQFTTTAHDIVIPINGAVAAASEFSARSKNVDLSAEERDTSRIIHDLLINARVLVNRERDGMLAAMADAMSLPKCPGDRPRY